MRSIQAENERSKKELRQEVGEEEERAVAGSGKSKKELQQKVREVKRVLLFTSMLHTTLRGMAERDSGVSRLPFV